MEFINAAAESISTIAAGDFYHSNLLQRSRIRTRACRQRNFTAAPTRLPPSRSQLDTIDFFELFPASRRVVVVAPHPDDEVIGCGGLLAALAAHDRAVMLIAVTDGEACYPEISSAARANLAAIRQRESMIAWQHLGLSPCSIIRLGFRDGEIEQDSELLSSRLFDLLEPDDLVITTWRGDHHCDHMAVGACCVEVTRALGATLFEVPVWMWHRVDPHLVPWYAAKRIELTPSWLQRKHQALAAHRSQFIPPADVHATPVLEQSFLSAWLQPFEVMFAS